MALRKLTTIRNALAAITLVLAFGAGAQEQPARSQLALMGTVPLYWGEAEDMADLLNGSGTGHWARPILEAEFELVPLDYLSAEALAPHQFLLMAQPRGLSAEENVALDGWVRGGGRLLLFADPMMTGESRFAAGDRRRPQDVALLSPILAHWGLELQFDEEQVGGLKWNPAQGTSLPLNLPGSLHLLPDGACQLEAEQVIARCQLGAGEALIVADAAILDLDGPYPQAREGLSALIDSIFAENGKFAGMTRSDWAVQGKNGAIPPFLRGGPVSDLSASS